MFETVELGRNVDKESYKQQIPTLRTALLQAQAQLKKANFSVVVVIAGVDGAGKGDTVNLLREWMDPRYVDTHALGLPTQEEEERPYFWRYWRLLPSHGRIGIFFRSWYTSPIIKRAYGEISDLELHAATDRINMFERALIHDRTLLLKYWFHLSKKAQRKRFKRLEKNPETKWRVTETDWKHHKQYDTFREVSATTLLKTSSGERPWTLVEGEHERYRSLFVARHLLEQMRLALEHQRGDRLVPKSLDVTTLGEVEGATNLLETLDLSQKMPDDEYRSTLKKEQAQLNRHSRKLLKKGKSCVIVFEGWDAAGKGGAIRRVTRALDARQYKLIPIAAPTPDELARHYLWRFWKHVPRDGHFAFFDRSWYGRVLVERVEGFAEEFEWRRAYKEINDFEEQLADDGIIIVKFWLHIDQEEQLRRFKEREKIPYKNYKITPEDYRNREKWPAYEKAVHEMIQRTSNTFAPWTLVESNDKKFARIKVIQTLNEALAKGL